MSSLLSLAVTIHSKYGFTDGLSCLHAEISPLFKMLCHGNCTAGTLARSHTPVLLKSSVAINGWLIVSCCFIDIICTPIYINLSFGCRSWWSPGPPTVYNVIFHQWVSGPAINAKIRISGWLIVASIVDRNVSNLGICFGAVKGFSLAEQRIPDIVPPTAEGSAAIQGHARITIILPKRIIVTVFLSGLLIVDCC